MIIPAISKLSRVTDLCFFLLSEASKTMLETLFLMEKPAFPAHLTDVKTQYSDNKFDVFSGK